MNLISFFKSFYYAFKGLALMFKGQRSFFIHIIAMLIAISGAIYFPITKTEWLVIIIVIAIVLAAEIFNTAIEKLTDMVEPDFNEKAAQVKDLAAAAVLICAIGSLITGILIFLPHLLELFIT